MKSSLLQRQTFLAEFATYVANNTGNIVNYGERLRAGERISTGFVESAINQIVDKRMDKRQSMRWTPRGAHLLLQTRNHALNGDLNQLICGRYPSRSATSDRRSRSYRNRRQRACDQWRHTEDGSKAVCNSLADRICITASAAALMAAVTIR